MIIGTDLKRSSSNLKQTVSAASDLLWWNISMLLMKAKPKINSTDLKRSALNRKQTFSVATTLFLWNVSVLFITATTYDDRNWFEVVWFESEASGVCDKHFLIVKRLIIVHDSQNPRTSVMIWTGLLQIWNQRFLQQPFSYCETSQCCPWQPKPRIIGTDLKRSASNLKPTVCAVTISYSETSRCCHRQPTPKTSCTALQRSASNLKQTISAATIFWRWKSQSFPSQQIPRIIGTHSKMAASNLKPTDSAAIIVVKRLNVHHGSKHLW